jgi:hypothetical protein
MHRKIALVASNAPAAMEAEAELRPLYDFVDLNEADLLIALGGDGFLLHMLHAVLDQRRSMPVFGMNRGTIGFLMNEFRIEGWSTGSRGAPLPDPSFLGDITTISGERHILPAINEISLLRETRQTAKLESDHQRKDDARGTRLRRRARVDAGGIDRLQPQRQRPDPAARIRNARADPDQPLPPAALARRDRARIDEHPLQRPRSRKTPGQRRRRPARRCAMWRALTW